MEVPPVTAFDLHYSRCAVVIQYNIIYYALVVCCYRFRYIKLHYKCRYVLNV